MSARRIRGQECGSSGSTWPTPCASLHSDGESPESWLACREELKVTAGNGNGAGMPLAIAAKLWPSPASRDWRDDGDAPSAQGRKSPCLPAAVALAKPASNWPTPHGIGGPEDRPSGPSANELGNAVLKASATNWPTPRTTDVASGRGCIEINGALYRPSEALAQGRLVGGANLSDAAEAAAGYQRSGGKLYLTLPGATGTAPVPADSGPADPASHSMPGKRRDSPRSTNSRQGLNARWVLQLMGYSADWLDGVEVP